MARHDTKTQSLQNRDGDTLPDAYNIDSFTVFVAPGIDTIHGPVVISDLAPNESVHIIVAEAYDHDIVTAQRTANGQDTEVIYRNEVVAILKGLVKLNPNQVIFAPMTLIDAPSQEPASNVITGIDWMLDAKPKSNGPAQLSPKADADLFVWNGFDRSSLRLKPITVADYIPGLDRLEANLGFGPLTPKIAIEDSGDGDTFVRVNGKALFRLQGVAAHELSNADVQVNRI